MIKSIKLSIVLSIIIVGSCFISCNIGKKLPKSDKSSFSKSEIQYIMESDSSAPMRVFKITNLSDSLLLRKTCSPVKADANDAVLAHFVMRLYNTVTDSMSLGVGIAAPQVGILKQIIYVQRFDKPTFPYEVYLNPKILEYSEKKQPCPEGCLSIPDKQAMTKNRSHSIILEYDKMNGEHVQDTVTSFTAVVFQHEIDHLNGILFIDHLEEELNSNKKI